METYAMFAMKKFDLKLPVLQIILVYVFLALFLASCDVTTSCNLQAVAGGAQYCEETQSGE
jgi:hypothetical protein